MIAFTIAVLCVDDLERAARFYRDVLGLRVERADENHILFEGGLEVHVGEVLLGYAYGERRLPDGPWGRDNVAVHFRADDLEDAFERVSEVATPLHPIRLEPWGERFFRVLDPDGHLVEIAETQPHEE